jgi:DNA-binding CsgD family transcriptional regulator
MKEERIVIQRDLFLPDRFNSTAADMVRADPSLIAWAVTRDLEVTYVSDRAATVLGETTPEHVVGRSLAEFAPEPVADRMSRIVGRALQEGAPVVGTGVWRGQRVRSSFIPNGPSGEVLIITRPAPLSLCESADIDEASYVDLGPFAGLTRRELEVLAYLGLGLSLTEIAERLFRSPKTIKRFREEISKKLGVGDRCRLSQMARDAGLQPHHADLERVQWTPPPPPGRRVAQGVG